MVKRMNKKKSNVFGTPFAIVALLILSACTSSMELEDGDYTGDETVAEASGDESAPADVVPGDEIAAEGAEKTADTSGAGAPTEGNPELELAASAEKNSGKENVASTDSAGTPEKDTGAADGAKAASAEDLPALDLATDLAPLAPVAAKDLPPPTDVDVTPKVESPAAKVEETVAKIEEVAPKADATEAPVEIDAPDSKTEVASAPAETPSGDGVSYKVQKGDTLMKISWEQYGDLFRWREIYALNKSKIQDPNHVPPGTVIQIAGKGRSPASAMEHNGDQYLIMLGDTLGKISGKVYGSMGKWKKIWENNKSLIRDPNKIYAGFYLYYVPEAKMTSREDEGDALESVDS
jgi:nucleoid-associated protein YgaU